MKYRVTYKAVEYLCLDVEANAVEEAKKLQRRQMEENLRNTSCVEAGSLKTLLMKTAT